MTAKEAFLADEEINDLLRTAPVGYLALSKDNQPYLVPLNFIYESKAVYFHCAPEGRKIDYIKANPRVCFQTGENGSLISGENPCKHNYSYRSVIIEGLVEEITEAAEKEKILRRITAKYAAPEVAGGPISSARIAATGVYRIAASVISGKRNS
jgi:uncharacterized protein